MTDIRTPQQIVDEGMEMSPRPDNQLGRLERIAMSHGLHIRRVGPDVPMYQVINVHKEVIFGNGVGATLAEIEDSFAGAVPDWGRHGPGAKKTKEADVASRETCVAWIEGFCDGLMAGGVDEDEAAARMAWAMPTPIRNGLVRMEVEDFVAEKIAAGQLIRLTGNRVIEPGQYDPEKHGPKVE